MFDKVDKFILSSFHTVGLFEDVNGERQCNTFKSYQECPIAFQFHKKARINGFSVFDEDGVELAYDYFDTIMHLEPGDIFKLQEINLVFDNMDQGGTVFTDGY
jgi:hypothetical protein